jgi:RNA processing factor Prp31
MGKQQINIKFNPVISVANKYLEHITTYVDKLFFFFKNWYFIKFPELEITKHIR